MQKLVKMNVKMLFYGSEIGYVISEKKNNITADVKSMGCIQQYMN